VKIEKIIKENQPDEFSKLKHKHSTEKLIERDLKELMSHSSYKRGTGGSIRQVR